MPPTWQHPTNDLERLAQAAGTGVTDPNFQAALAFAREREAERQKTARIEEVRGTLSRTLNAELAKLPKTPEGQRQALDLMARYQRVFEESVDQ